MFLVILGILSCLVPKGVRLSGFIGEEGQSGVALFDFFFFSLC